MYIYSFFLHTQLSPSLPVHHQAGGRRSSLSQRRCDRRQPSSLPHVVARPPAGPPPFTHGGAAGSRPLPLPAQRHSGAHPPPIPARRHGRRPAASLPRAVARPASGHLTSPCGDGRPIPPPCGRRSGTEAVARPTSLNGSVPNRLFGHL